MRFWGILNPVCPKLADFDWFLSPSDAPDFVLGRLINFILDLFESDIWIVLFVDDNAVYSIWPE